MIERDFAFPGYFNLEAYSGASAGMTAQYRLPPDRPDISSYFR